MKKIVFLLSCLFVFLLAGCSGSDDQADTPNTSVDRTANLQPVGSSARDFLTQENFNSLVIDIVFVTGFRPSQTSINNLINFIDERTFKPGGIEVQFTEIPDTGDDEFTIQEIAAIEEEHRSLYNDGNQLAMFMFFADAPSENSSGNSVVLGAAFRNTSIVIYQSSILQLSNNNLGVTIPTIETGVLNHEMAHLFGLVDLGTPLQSDHLDAENGNHCNVPNCLMEAQIDFATGAMTMMTGDEVPVLDALCIADLQANGGK
ncbi:membrane metalloprotease [Leptobacterium flavescens]|uniref:Membrane metalloprotease n=1 Tax=Leptobacterium flavescens TaxID=472055 RepID=A0A6P0UQ45_9FLAO|nr:membrane metalloprotease [Leptobacterium flavescens]NER15255.1 membrane metalloprotease [Leptobacterium flavescens]